VRLQDKERYRQRYTERYREFGYDPQTLGWGKGGRQPLRFAALMEMARSKKGSVLDVGCGFGDLYKFLIDSGWNGKYVGVDLVSVLVDEARNQYPGIDVRICDILSDYLEEKFDYVVASGIFNARLQEEANEYHIERMLGRMFELARLGVAADFMSSHVDFRNEEAWHTDPGWVLSVGFKLTRRVVMRHDYLPYEFCLYLYRSDEITDESTYTVKHDSIR
jgi:SAM-dependent methyltransferase